MEIKKEYGNKEWQQQELHKLLASVCAMVIVACGVNLFIVPAGFYSGGALGFSQVVRTLLVRYAHINFGSVDIAGILYFMINIPLFVLAFCRIGKPFFVRTMVCVASMTFFMTVIPIPTEPLVDDRLTASLMGGLISGFGSGMALRFGSSGGGLDIVGLYFTKKYPRFSVGRMNLCINLALYLVCALLFDISVVIYSILYAFIASIMVDRAHIQNIRTEVFIFTKEDPERITFHILNQLNRGATYWEAKGAYQDTRTFVIFVVVSKFELQDLRHYIHQIDPHAFFVSKENVSVDGKFAKKL